MLIGRRVGIELENLRENRTLAGINDYANWGDKR
ncbi:hypothetical protein V1281_006190 [Nitrobacteraceae bacterium AZCC 2161]